MNSVMVTGCSGFVGRSCLRALAGRGASILPVTHSTPFVGTVRCHRVNLLDRRQTSALLAGTRPSHLLHLAWLTTPGSYWTSPVNWAWAEASLHLLRCFAEYGGRRAVFVGSCAECAWNGGTCNEAATPLRPASAYGASKQALGAAVDRLAKRLGLSCAWARLFFLYGPHEHPQRLVPYVIQSLLTETPALCTDGRQRRDFLHVSDAAEALAALLDSDLRGPVNVGAGAAPAVRDLIKMIGEALGKPQLLRLGALPSRPGDPSIIAADTCRLRAHLGWSPRHTLREGLKQTIDWWRAQSVYGAAA